jgi:hypothetical protein
MNRKISYKEIRYLLDHLESLYDGARLGDYLNTGEKRAQPSFKVPLSDQPLDPDHLLSIDEIPVLFPGTGLKKWYSVEGKEVVFHHDILKSAFYLLSGYQEVRSDRMDNLGRFPWRASMQGKLGITHKPVVNYYFDVILEAFGQFCSLNRLDFKKRTPGAPVLFLSHDVDRIRKYTLRNLGYAALQLTGLRPGPEGFRGRFRNLGVYFRGILSFTKDPFWTFQELTGLEKKLHISSTWFFLEKTREDNSRYRFSSREIVNLIRDLSAKGHEIALHGTLESSGDPEAMTGALGRLNAVCDTPVTGVRQHFLRYKNPDTPVIQSSAGLGYDATLGFAEQIGFRNSYAYPFKLYNFDNEEAMEIWQLPLNVMELTLLEYMGVKPASVPDAIEPLLSEVKKFSGVFSLLWHNCNLEEDTYPGIREVYGKVLKGIMQSGFVSLNGRQTVEHYSAMGQISP